MNYEMAAAKAVAKAMHYLDKIEEGLVNWKFYHYQINFILY